MESLPARLIAGEADVGAAASDSRLAPRRPDLQPLLAPRSIAFVGASARPNTPGHDMLRMIRRGGFDSTNSA